METHKSPAEQARTSRARLSRRALLGLGAGAAVAVTAPAGVAAYASGSDGRRPDRPVGAAGLAGKMEELERTYAARLGVFARDTGTGRLVAYRAGERFPMCSVFKSLAAAAVLRDLDHDGEFLAKRIHYTQNDVDTSGPHHPVTGKPENVARGLTVAELCAAAVGESDNAAGNLLMKQLGGPTALTRFCRSLGDRTTRLDRWEPELNSAEPWRTTDTTSPRAVGTTLGHLVVGEALADADRRRLTTWLVENTTDSARFGAGLPDDWKLADKTGGGAQYGVANDVGVVWPPGRAPIVLSVLSTKYDPKGPTDDVLVAKAASLVADALT